MELRVDRQLDQPGLLVLQRDQLVQQRLGPLGLDLTLGKLVPHVHRRLDVAGGVDAVDSGLSQKRESVGAQLRPQPCHPAEVGLELGETRLGDLLLQGQRVAHLPDDGGRVVVVEVGLVALDGAVELVGVAGVLGERLGQRLLHDVELIVLLVRWLVVPFGGELRDPGLDAHLVLKVGRGASRVEDDGGVDRLGAAGRPLLT